MESQTAATKVYSKTHNVKLQLHSFVSHLRQQTTHFFFLSHFTYHHDAIVAMLPIKPTIGKILSTMKSRMSTTSITIEKTSILHTPPFRKSPARATHSPPIRSRGVSETAVLLTVHRHAKTGKNHDITVTFHMEYYTTVFEVSQGVSRVFKKFAIYTGLIDYLVNICSWNSRTVEETTLNFEYLCK